MTPSVSTLYMYVYPQLNCCIIKKFTDWCRRALQIDLKIDVHLVIFVYINIMPQGNEGSVCVCVCVCVCASTVSQWYIPRLPREISLRVC